jgi:hypothetical protein
MNDKGESGRTELHQIKKLIVGVLFRVVITKK